MTTWKIDAAHSEIQFKVKHLMISTITGNFTSFDSSVQTNGDDFTSAVVSFEANVDSITTKNADRDKHLQAEDFFHAASYPKVTFVSKEVKKVDDANYTVSGDLTVRGVTKPVVLNAEYGGIITDPWGQVKAGFELTGKINRKDYGLSFHAVTEAGGIVVGDEVKLHLAVEYIKQA
ncbi:YceI family protein [Chitinophaga agrisoli]|uniref:YceI family protein n=1 Tax=Chitinophaga agrisoli TaxID=2607653 RepID=A0A5B2W2X7_9BACT|nr:YceI family protein [Chitinophaga agrisoli]KAA2244609.1 YceI family protein [Chitinophaga agrisoli]